MGWLVKDRLVPSLDVSASVVDFQIRRLMKDKGWSFDEAQKIVGHAISLARNSIEAQGDEEL